MFDGKRFFPLTGTPIPKMLFSSTLLADCEPDPFTVATLMLKSLTTRCRALMRPVLDPGPGLLSPFGGIPFRVILDEMVIMFHAPHVIIVTRNVYTYRYLTRR